MKGWAGGKALTSVSHLTTRRQNKERLPKSLWVQVVYGYTGEGYISFSGTLLTEIRSRAWPGKFTLAIIRYRGELFPKSNGLTIRIGINHITINIIISQVNIDFSIHPGKDLLVLILIRHVEWRLPWGLQERITFPPDRTLGRLISRKKRPYESDTIPICQVWF